MKLHMKLPAALPTFAALGLLAVAGGLVALAAPSAPSAAAAHGLRAQVTQAPALSGASHPQVGVTSQQIASGVPTATAGQPTPTDTPQAGPTATAGSPTPTDTPTDTPTPGSTATPAPQPTATPSGPSWHDIASWSGASASTSYQYLGSWGASGTYRIAFTCDPASNGAQWMIEVVVGNGSSNGSVAGSSLCKSGTSGAFPGNSIGYSTFGIQAEVDAAGDTGPWTITVQEWY